LASGRRSDYTDGNIALWSVRTYNGLDLVFDAAQRAAATYR
jgi:hypothetical protein